MTDNQLYDFFKTRSNSFDEMPSELLWNKISENINSEIPPVSRKFLSSRILLLLILALISAVLLVVYFSSHEPQIQKPVEKKEIIIEKQVIMETQTVSNEIPVKSIDTVKKKRFQRSFRILSTKGIAVTPNATNVANSKVEIPEIAEQKANDSLKFKPQIAGNRYLYENKAQLTKEEFDVFVKEVLKENELNHGRLIVIKSKGHIPFRQFIKRAPVSPGINNSKTTLKKEAYYSGKIFFAKDTLIINPDTLLLNDKLKKNR